MSLVYLYDGSYDGLLTAVFEAYARREVPDALAEEENLQVAFGQEVSRIGADEARARRVERGLERKLGKPFLEKVWAVSLSGDPDKATALYRYIRRGLTVGRLVYSDLAHPDVLAVDKLYRLVGREAHLLKEFLRFSEVEGGVFYAKISPEHSVVPLLMPHFTDRYSVQPFLIHDDVHEVAGVFDLRGWHMVETAGLTLPDITADELRFRRLWKGFYDAIAIRERFNPRCRRNHMPKKYWQNMTEHNFAETPKTARLDARQAARTPQPRTQLEHGRRSEAPGQDVASGLVLEDFRR